MDLLEWDFKFFVRQVGALAGDVGSPKSVSRDLEAAANAGFVYLICRPPVEDAMAISTLGRACFYLTDIGVTWWSEAQTYLGNVAPVPAGSIRAATTADVPRLFAEALTLFRRSRFYSVHSSRLTRLTAYMRRGSPTPWTVTRPTRSSSIQMPGSSLAS